MHLGILTDLCLWSQAREFLKMTQKSLAITIIAWTELVNEDPHDSNKVYELTRAKKWLFLS